MIGIDANLIKEMAEKGRRLDNRKFDEYREISVEAGLIQAAEGSARVKIGNSEVVAGIKMDIGEPFPDTPNEGTMMVSAELVPLASPDFEAGPPREEAIELSRVVDRAIRESKCIDFQKLCVKEGEKVWSVYVDIDVINDDGNLIDACGLAAMQALLNAKMPEIVDDKINIDKKTGPLPIKGVAVSTTFAKISDKIVADPSSVEDKAKSARLTVGTIEIDGKTYLCSMQKGGSEGFSLEEIEEIISMAEKKGNELRKLIKK